MTSLTARLLQSDRPALHTATSHPFLKAAATSALDRGQLKQWLAQDRLYAIAYVNFIGNLLARISIPTTTNCLATKEGRIAGLLIDCLDNIRRELNLFEQTAEEQGWSEDMHSAMPTVPTRAYQDIFAGATAPSQSFIVGLTVLWATEECYLRAWTCARSTDHGCGTDLDVVHTVFIPNWSSGEFAAFVARIRELLDEYESSLEVGDRHWTECETAFRQVLWAETQFWPKVE